MFNCLKYIKNKSFGVFMSIIYWTHQKSSLINKILLKMDEKKNIHINLYFIGMLGTGKSSIINRIVNNSFSFVYNMTTEIT